MMLWLRLRWYFRLFIILTYLSVINIFILSFIFKILFIICHCFIFQAFRAGVLEIPEEQAMASFHSITLPTVPAADLNLMLLARPMEIDNLNMLVGALSS
jgi:hypothetical protein